MAKLWVSEQMAIYRGSLRDNTRHSHLAAQMCFATTGALEVEVNGERLSAPGLVIAGQVPHRIETRDSELYVVLMEPSRSIRRFLANQSKRLLDQGVIGDLVRPGNDPASVFSSIRGLFGDEPSVDPRVQQVIHHLTTQDGWEQRLPDLAAVAGLSPSRLTHLFREELGFSLKHYRLWVRTLFAIGSLQRPSDLTTVALSCGFSDLSHLSRTFRSFFGIKMSEMFQNDRSVQVQFLDRE